MRSVVFALLTILAIFSASTASAMEAPTPALRLYDEVVGRSDFCLYDSNGGMSCSFQGKFVGYLSAADIAAANRDLIALRHKK